MTESQELIDIPALTEALFAKRAALLCEWTSAEDSVFFINHSLGNRIGFKDGVLTLTESDQGGIHPGEEIEIRFDDLEEFFFEENGYQFIIITAAASPHGGQGYDIEAYCLTRMDFPQDHAKDADHAYHQNYYQGATP